MREKEEERLQQLEDAFRPKDEVMEHHLHDHQHHLQQHPPPPPPPPLQQQHQEQLHHSLNGHLQFPKEREEGRLDDEGEEEVDDDEGELVDEEDEKDMEDDVLTQEAEEQLMKDFEEKGMEESQEKELQQREQELMLELESAGDTTPLSVPSLADEESGSSPEDAASAGAKPEIEVFELQESSSDAASPEMEAEKLFIKLKEAQYKNAVADAELAKLRAKMILLENADASRKQLEKKHEDTVHRLRETEKTAGGCQEREQPEKDFIQERESLLEQQSEKDQQYNDLVKYLKDRVFQLESDLAEARKAAGLPPVPSQAESVEAVQIPITKATAAPVRAVLNGDDVEEGYPGAARDTDEDGGTAGNGVQFASSLERDIDAAEDEAVEAAAAAAASSRQDVRPPDSESGLETWIKHDSKDDSQSDTSSSVSQTSYDPSKPQFRSMGSEIPEAGDEEEAGVSLVSAKPSSSGKVYIIWRLG
nr:hypothetical protein BaRGS_003626 [Batillaria attramentaria]